MITSMTGFGRGSAEVGGASATVEMRSVNSRFCEVSLRVPRDLVIRESDIQNQIRAAFDRGRITVQVQLAQNNEEAIPIEVDAEAARAYTRLLERLREAAGIESPVELQHLLTFSDVFKPADEAASAADEAAWQAVRQALAEAIRSMKDMRAQEGAALQSDLMQRLDGIERALAAVEERAPVRITEARERLRHRLAEVVADERINPERLEFEIAVLADRLDVTEECVRLRAHLQAFRSAFDQPEAVGRKLNFLVQEMNREVNTIGSKANDALIAHRAVEMKEELERIREQVQNIE
ncbi:MAG TPA: YicC/YloC family endoribonuclease [Rhodothermales bacterium]|nr:YicC/YloC family endoribonuclease [Rhodothermales bacterium]